MASPTTKRVQKRRDALRAAGLRPLQIWVPDTRRPDLIAECRRQSAVVARADAEDADLAGFMESAVTDIGDLDE